ncbi:MAG: prephenate dehydrogenase/arogenate dehydrogenase family protein [Dehalococcoidia bacterium]|nr:prephenate dehydrogenase/arogenate dehydrogenase family protein [Dehalococcoidia bacterium]
MDRVVIIGLGLIGGSMGLALKKAKVKNLEIVGIDVDRDAVVKASRKKAVDSTERTAAEAVKKAAIVVVATPLLVIPEVFKAIAESLPSGCVVTDTGSTKEQVMAWAEEILPERVHFVGGHPMAGKEISGIGGADANLFVEKSYCVVPSASASTGAVDLVVSLAQTVGSNPFFINAQEHDALVGGISHLPLLLSAALVSVTTRSPSWREMSVLASSGYRDVSRLASSDPKLGFGIAKTNKVNLIRWIDGYIEVLSEYRRMVLDDGEDLVDELDKVLLAREKWLSDAKQSDEDDLMKDLPTASERMSELFLGGNISRLMRREQEITDELRRPDKK